MGTEIAWTWNEQGKVMGKEKESNPQKKKTHVCMSNTSHTTNTHNIGVDMINLPVHTLVAELPKRRNGMLSLYFYFGPSLRGCEAAADAQK